MNFNNLLKSIFDYDPDGPNIHHLLSVHEYSVLIAQMENVERICFIIGHHHTYKAIDGIDFQILDEADDGFRLCA